MVDKDGPIGFYGRDYAIWRRVVALVLEWLAQGPVEGIALWNVAWLVPRICQLGILCSRHLLSQEWEEVYRVVEDLRWHTAGLETHKIVKLSSCDGNDDEIELKLLKMASISLLSCCTDLGPLFSAVHSTSNQHGSGLSEGKSSRQLERSSVSQSQQTVPEPRPVASIDMA